MLKQFSKIYIMEKKKTWFFDEVVILNEFLKSNLFWSLKWAKKMLTNEHNWTDQSILNYYFYPEKRLKGKRSIPLIINLFSHNFYLYCKGTNNPRYIVYLCDE